MASCVECNVKMGYSETNASRNHDGLCIACYVKSLVKTKINAANITKSTRERDLSAVDEMSPTVTVNNLQAKKDGDQPLKAGSQSDVPLLGSSNASNFYSTYSQLQYGVVV